MLLALILSNKDNFASSTVGIFDSDVVPSSLYFSNMITPRWEDLYGDLISIENPIRIKRFAPANQAIETLFRSWIRTQSNTLSFTGTADDGSTVIYPKWEKFEALTIDEMNLQLIKDIKYLNTLDKTELSSDEVLPDTSLLIQELSMENGIKAHLQINNIAYF
jgi:ABC-type multidrug transport system ATPase subunit